MLGVLVCGCLRGGGRGTERPPTRFSSEANAGIGRARHFRIAEAEPCQAVFALVARQRVD